MWSYGKSKHTIVSVGRRGVTVPIFTAFQDLYKRPVSPCIETDIAPFGSYGKSKHTIISAGRRGVSVPILTAFKHN